MNELSGHWRKWIDQLIAVLSRGGMFRRGLLLVCLCWILGVPGSVIWIQHRLGSEHQRLLQQHSVLGEELVLYGHQLARLSAKLLGDTTLFLTVPLPGHFMGLALLPLMDDRIQEPEPASPQQIAWLGSVAEHYGLSIETLLSDGSESGEQVADLHLEVSGAAQEVAGFLRFLSLHRVKIHPLQASVRIDPATQVCQVSVDLLFLPGYPAPETVTVGAQTEKPLPGGFVRLRQADGSITWQRSTGGEWVRSEQP